MPNNGNKMNVIKKVLMTLPRNTTTNDAHRIVVRRTGRTDIDLRLVRRVISTMRRCGEWPLRPEFAGPNDKDKQAVELDTMKDETTADPPSNRSTARTERAARGMMFEINSYEAPEDVEPQDGKGCPDTERRIFMPHLSDLLAVVNTFGSTNAVRRALIELDRVAYYDCRP